MLPKKVLITGANGFIGSFLAEEGVRHGYTIYAGIRQRSNVRFLPEKSVRIYSLSLSSRELLQKQLKVFNQSEGGFDYIIHNAGITRARKKEDFQLVNATYTKNLVDAVLAAGRLPKKFIFISSLAACGPGDPVNMEPIRPWEKDHPISAYAKSKLAAEEYIRSVPGLPYIILRPTAVYGPRDKDFLRYFRLIAKGFEPYLGSHPQALSFIYVKDLSRAVFELLSIGRARSSWLVSDGKVYAKDDLGKAVRQILDKRTIRIRLPLAGLQVSAYCLEKLCSIFGKTPFLRPEKLKEITASNWACDSSGLWQETGSSPAYTLEAGLRETFEWYSQSAKHDQDHLFLPAR